MCYNKTMKNFIIIILTIATLSLVGIFYINNNLINTDSNYVPITTVPTIINSTTTIINNSTTTAATQSVSVSGMQRYEDINFGFSFWYPSNWTVSNTTVQNSKIYGDGIVVKRYLVKSPNGLGLSIEEFTSPKLSIIDGTGVGACPVCSTVNYYFDSTQHMWMKIYPNKNESIPDSQVSVSMPADISINTMGGLHTFMGSRRFGGNMIVPLSAKNFLIVSSLDSNTGVNESYLVNTIFASDPSVAQSVSVFEQQAIVEKEKTAYWNF